MLYEIKIVHFLSCQSFTGQQYNFVVIDGIDRIMNEPLTIPNREVKHDFADGTVKTEE